MLQALPIVSWLERFRAGTQAPQALTVEITVTSRDPGPLVLADPSALQVIFRNLMENTMRHAQAEAAHARVSVADDGGHLCVSFTDDGRGFGGDSRQLGSLFFRGAGSHGAGVGLYLIRTLMTRMGGRVVFNAQPGNSFVTQLYFLRAEERA
jgi:signal transduction histidine kinase